ncbi:MAG: hypothetical protein JWQ02_62 [Capsulimonas sp.]|nr:hypothetical protein [Capsulimonas sp.]
MFAAVCLFSSLSAVHAQTPASEDAAYFDYDAQARFDVTETPMGMQDGATVTRITYPSPVVTPYAENNTVTAYLFLPAGAGPHPAMVVLHEWNPRSTRAGFGLAGAAARANVAALVMVEPYSLNRRAHNPKGDDPAILSGNLPEMVGALRQAVLDARRGLDYLSRRPDIDPKRLGVGGISLGGVLSGLVTKVDPRVQATVTLVGGADFARGFWVGLLTRKYRGRILRDGYDYPAYLRAMTPFDAGHWPRPIDPSNALMIDGRYDLVILPQGARALSQALGDTKIVWLNSGHYGASLSAKPAGNLATRFLRARFFGEQAAYHPPDTLPSKTIKLGVLLGGHEGLSPAAAYQVINFDRAGRYSVDGQLTLHGLSAGLSARLNQTLSLGLEFPLFHGDVKPKPYLLAHIVL